MKNWSREKKLLAVLVFISLVPFISTILLLVDENTAVDYDIDGTVINKKVLNGGFEEGYYVDHVYLLTVQTQDGNLVYRVGEKKFCSISNGDNITLHYKKGGLFNRLYYSNYRGYFNE